MAGISGEILGRLGWDGDGEHFVDIEKFENIEDAAWGRSERECNLCVGEILFGSY